jgi:hypothetical protein
MTHPPTWGHYPPQSPPATPAYHPNPLEPMLWGRALDQLSRIEGRLIHGDLRFDGLTAAVTRLETRMDSMETSWRRERLRRRLPCWASAGRQTLDLLRAIASPREWLAGAVIVALAVKGILSPETLRAIVLKLLGIE